MVSQTNEAALEAHIERALCGSTREERQAQQSGGPVGMVQDRAHSYGVKSAGYEFADPASFDCHFAIDREAFWRFLRSTQAEELKKLEGRHDWERLVLERLDRKIKKDGLLHVLKKGLSIDDAHLTLFYRQAYNDLNPDVIRLYEANIFGIARQVYYSNANQNSVDMVIFLNGLPLATLELKNPWTGQTVYHARKQYVLDRDPKEPLFQFKRCLVHFAVDTEEVFMTTRIDGKRTYFLPFNKGHNNGKGNPPNTAGHRSAYLWEEILQKDSLSSIIEQFAKVVVEKDKEGKKKEMLFFPRYHQLDVVRRILSHAKAKGAGQRYLIQHSAGSGKSNSITWLAYQLIELYDPSGHHNVFDSVIVVTDRRVLDKQLKDNIKSFSEVKNIVAHAFNSQELKQHLENGKRLIITTLQKFPFIVDGIEDLSDRKFGVIIDEAHSSQSGSAADQLNRAISAGQSAEDDEPEDFQELILRAMEGRRMGQNASYFAFTATPKNATLEKFGQQGPDGKFRPFHLYSMKQAIEEGFILDVLSNYTTYRSYYELQKSITENPLFETAKAQKKLKAFVEAHPDTIEVKAQIMVNHFMEKVYQPKKLKGKAKAMVVTRNIESAIRYFFAIRKALGEVNAPFQAIVAFSGKKTIDGIEYTEDSLNNFPGKDIPENFDKDEYKLLVVANKFLTGFDQPKLHTMYVDKKLQGVLAVQTLSRLNRCNEKLGKKDTFVLDFYNSVDDIKQSFDPFYANTSLSQATDVNVLHDLKDALDEFGIYEQSEVEQFNEGFFKGVEADQLHPIIDVSVNRFDTDLEDEEKIDFKIKAKQFVKIYAQVACMISFTNIQWEMLHWYLKFLIPKLRVKDPQQDQLDELLNSVDLSTYGLERAKLNAMIGLDDSDTELDPQNPNVRGTHQDEVIKDPLEEIIKAFNERFFQGWDATPEEQRVKFLNIAQHVANDPTYKTHVLDNQDEQNRKLALEKLIRNAVNKERRRELELYQLFSKDPEFKKAFESSIINILMSQNTQSVEMEQ